MAGLLVIAHTHSLAMPSHDRDAKVRLQSPHAILLLVFETDLLECPGCREQLIVRLVDFCSNSLSHEKMVVIVPKPGILISEEHARIYHHQFAGILKHAGVEIPFVVPRKSDLSVGMVNNFLVLQANLPGIQIDTISGTHSTGGAPHLMKRLKRPTSGLNVFAIAVWLMILLLLTRRWMITKTHRKKLGEKIFAWPVWYHPVFHQARVNLILLGLGMLILTLTYLLSLDFNVIVSSFPVLVLFLAIQSKAGVMVREKGVVINLDAVAWEEISGWKIDRTRNLLRIAISVNGRETVRLEIPPRFHDEMAFVLTKHVPGEKTA